MRLSGTPLLIAILLTSAAGIAATVGYGLSLHDRLDQLDIAVESAGESPLGPVTRFEDAPGTTAADAMDEIADGITVSRSNCSFERDSDGWDAITRRFAAQWRRSAIGTVVNESELAADVAISVRWLDDEGAVAEERGLVIPGVPAGESRWEATGLVPHFERDRGYGACLARLEVAFIAR